MRSDHVDTLWKQGYGFNNPNPDRVRQGLDPVNLDGKTDGERKDNYFSRVFGDMIVYGVKTAFASVADRLRR